jgi:flap endonuclease-1
MGTQISSIITSREIKVEDLKGKRVVVDSFNLLYQFLTTIRQQDGSLLVDSKGHVTSHLSGLFFRTTKLMKEGIKLAFVFDGIAPELKKKERERRKELKAEAQRKYEEAEAIGDIELMRKYAGRTAILTKEMVEEAKELITALGLPIIDAPSEGEAEAAYLVKTGGFYAVVSQDTDSLLFGANKVIKNLSISGKKKKHGTSAYVSINPEIVDLAENLNTLGIDIDQLIVISMLCGTDFNIGGIKGLGPKKSLMLVKKHSKDFESLFKEANWDESFKTPWQEVFSVIKNMPVSSINEISWSRVDEKKIFEILVDGHEFTRERVENALAGLSEKQTQKGLSDFF